MRVYSSETKRQGQQWQWERMRIQNWWRPKPARTTLHSANKTFLCVAWTPKFYVTRPSSHRLSGKKHCNSDAIKTEVRIRLNIRCRTHKTSTNNSRVISVRRMRGNGDGLSHHHNYINMRLPNDLSVSLCAQFYLSNDQKVIVPVEHFSFISVWPAKLLIHTRNGWA